MDNEKMNTSSDEEMQGGRRHRGSKKHHSKRRGNASLRAWVTFVKKVQREEKVSYKEAMMRAKKRKDKGEKWRGGGNEMEISTDDEMEMSPNDEMEMSPDDDNENMYGGKRRRRTRRHRGSKKRKHGRRSRKHR